MEYFRIFWIFSKKSEKIFSFHSDMSFCTKEKSQTLDSGYY